MTVYTLSIVEGDIDHVLSGKDLFSPASPIAFSQLDPSTLVWLTEHGYEDPGRRVVVTPVGRDPEGVQVIASRDVAL
ncbi:hypothetical protein [Streptosporangium lutulentum]|uniref:Uncharacterized protein n=1 Tax=Streptosporangium lutulentum TaxID=1461250 RepID=A0ABT9QMT2_9ACTN|nr:hypothetical protein [Streptosporangium lutulentum]MDP9848078.1 hypothetical protein [Streptosporangium lutulentum]